VVADTLTGAALAVNDPGRLLAVQGREMVRWPDRPRENRLLGLVGPIGQSTTVAVTGSISPASPPGDLEAVPAALEAASRRAP
jgi:hypothetical protein